MTEEPVNIKEFKELARKSLPKMYFDFINGGAEDQYTLRENVAAFCSITLSFKPVILINKQGHRFKSLLFGLLSMRPRILVDVSRIDISTTILGYHTSSPIMIAPTGMHKFAHPEGLNSIRRVTD